MVEAVVYKAELNISPEELERNVLNSLKYPQFRKGGSTGAVAICAAGPSLLDQIPLLRVLHREGVPICAIKGVYRTLIGHGIVPTYCLTMDGKAGQERFFQTPHPAIEYLIAGQCHPAVFEALEGFNVTVFQCDAPHLCPRGTHYIRGGPTSAVKAISVMWAKGYEHIHLFGFDCCERNGQSHVYQDHDVKPVKDWWMGQKHFRATAQMVCQYNSFIEIFGSNRHIDLIVYGDGMIAEAWNRLNDPTRQMWTVDITKEPAPEIRLPPEITDYDEDLLAEAITLKVDSPNEKGIECPLL